MWAPFSGSQIIASPKWDYKPEIDENGYYHDADDAQTASYGHAAGAAEAQAVTVIVKRYFAAASRHDGVLACRLPTRSCPGGAIGLRPARASYLRGAMSCQAVLDRLFRRSAEVLSAPVTVTVVRVGGDHALAMLASPKMPAGYAALLRKSGHWGMEQLLASALT